MILDTANVVTAMRADNWLHRHGHPHAWTPAGGTPTGSRARWMTSFATTVQDVDRFAVGIAAIPDEP